MFSSSSVSIHVAGTFFWLHLQHLFIMKREKNQQDAIIRCLLLLLSQHVLGIIMPILRRPKTVLLHLVYALVLLDVVGSGCGALHCRM